MRTLQRLHFGVPLAAAAALGFSSCTYDPYYAYDPYYPASSYYGYGHGYGGATFTTSAFITTGDPRWGYDPYVRAYYDYGRRAYYDPYRYGYYPVGYRPVVVRYVPHPYGWRPGYARIAPPSRVTPVVLRDYEDRRGAYRRSNYPWARQIDDGPRVERRSSVTPLRADSRLRERNLADARDRSIRLAQRESALREQASTEPSSAAQRSGDGRRSFRATR